MSAGSTRILGFPGVSSSKTQKVIATVGGSIRDQCKAWSELCKVKALEEVEDRISIVFSLLLYFLFCFVSLYFNSNLTTSSYNIDSIKLCTVLYIHAHPSTCTTLHQNVQGITIKMDNIPNYLGVHLDLKLSLNAHFHF